jgi:hypothetical protein
MMKEEKTLKVLTLIWERKNLREEKKSCKRAWSDSLYDPTEYGAM